jgi:hypothetical protein
MAFRGCHIFGCARAARRGAVWCYNSAHLGVSTVRDRTFFCLTARDGGGPIFLCARGAAAVWCYNSAHWESLLYGTARRSVARRRVEL